MMAVDNSLTGLLSTLQESVESATKVLPNDNDISPAKDGISLLDVKNEMLLSYLQNLVFLIVLKLRSQSQSYKEDSEESMESSNIMSEVVKKLVELRVYLEKGVRPLETRLKYQIDKVVRAADDAARAAVTKSSGPTRVRKPPNLSGLEATSDSAESEVESVASAQTDQDIDELSSRPNPSRFVLSELKTSKTESKDGIYKPPRITPTALPTTQGREERGPRKPEKSATMDEFIAAEYSSAPVAEPSIGSTIVSGGRRMKSQKEREDEAARREYEESNFVRLPKESKKERARNGNQARNGGWGGEEWRGLGAGLDRIEQLTQKKGGSSGSLAKSRKRAIEDGPRGTGAQAGELFEKKRKVYAGYRK